MHVALTSHGRDTNGPYSSLPYDLLPHILFLHCSLHGLSLEVHHNLYSYDPANPKLQQLLQVVNV